MVFIVTIVEMQIIKNKFCFFAIKLSKIRIIWFS